MNILLKYDIYLKILHANGVILRYELNIVRESSQMSGVTLSDSIPSQWESHLCLQHSKCVVVLSLKGEKDHVKVDDSILDFNIPPDTLRDVIPNPDTVRESFPTQFIYSFSGLLGSSILSSSPLFKH